MAERLRLNYAIVGGQAVNAWVQPRATDDFDFVVAPEREKVAAFEAALGELGLRVRVREDPGGASGPDFLRLSDDTMTLLVDVQTAKTEYQLGLIKRARIAGEMGIRVATPEDLIITKLIAFRAEDQRDVARLIEGCELDWSYLEQWAHTWGVRERLEGYRTDIGRSGTGDSGAA